MSFLLISSFSCVVSELTTVHGIITNGPEFITFMNRRQQRLQPNLLRNDLYKMNQDFFYVEFFNNISICKNVYKAGRKVGYTGSVQASNLYNNLNVTLTYSIFDRFNHFFTFSPNSRYRAVVITLTTVMV